MTWDHSKLDRIEATGSNMIFNLKISILHRDKF